MVMVTHNQELAERYSTRIVRLRDGAIIGDTDPYTDQEAQRPQKKHKKISMSFATALSLSFQNLGTKKGRTLLTAFAGSIGIIGIALILGLSTGMNDYIDDSQKETMTSCPHHHQRGDPGPLRRHGGPGREDGPGPGGGHQPGPHRRLCRLPGDGNPGDDLLQHRGEQPHRL